MWLLISYINQTMSMENPLSDSAFDEVNNILDDNQATQTDILTFKIDELQKIVSTLTRTNERLILRIEELEYDLQQKNQQEPDLFNQEYSVLQGNFMDVQELLKSYRGQLEQHQQKTKVLLSQKNKVIAELQMENKEIRRSAEHHKGMINDLQIQNQMLQDAKENLLSEIQDLEASLRKSKLDTPKHSNYVDFDNHSQYGSDFNYNVQYELEKLIQKLVKELEHQRYLKKKFTEEIKTLQKDVLEQEKEIISKNNKIYSLEISAIKNNKSGEETRVRTRTGFKDQREQKDQRDIREYRDQRDPRDQRDQRDERRAVNKERDTPVHSRVKTFTLMELMNECVVLSCKEKLILSLKLIELYSKKYQKNDFSSQILQSLTVHNYNPHSPHLTTLKTNSHSQKEQDPQSENQQQLVWNLVFIMDSLLSQTPTKDRQLGESEAEQTLLEAISFFLENRDENNIEEVIQLRKIVEGALSDHLR